MSLKEIVSKLLRGSPLFRILSLVCAVAIAVGVFSLCSAGAKKTPTITSINPPVGSPGDIMIINGENFGPAREYLSYVEIGGSKITEGGFIEWTDTAIRFVLPANIQDGLVYVSSKNGKSKPVFFANAAGIPVAVPPNTKTTMPIIVSIQPEKAAPGTLLTITGSNFGEIRGTSKVYFTANRDDSASSVSAKNFGLEANKFDPKFIPADEGDFDYEYWSGNEVRVRVPDGAADGLVYIQTEKGGSNYYHEDIDIPVGKKTYSSRRTYLIQSSAEVDSIKITKQASLTLRIPFPPVTSRQPVAELSECTPDPVINEYKGTTIHQFDLSTQGPKKVTTKQSFVVATYTVETDINPKNVKNFSEKKRALFQTFTAADDLIQSRNDKVVRTAAEITKGYTNPFSKAKIVYDWLTANFKYSAKESNKPFDPEAFLYKKKGSAYDFAILYTSLLRACGVPAQIYSGILANADMKAIDHWWCAFYIENFGWVPVDPALGAGMEYKPFRPVENPSEWYFGNLDSQHIIFSRGWNSLKPTLMNSKTVYRDRSYALQSVWEESSEGVKKYSSLWNTPIVVGVY